VHHYKIKSAHQAICADIKKCDVFTVGEILRLSDQEIQVEIDAQRALYPAPEPVKQKQPDDDTAEIII
jgi:hypothetical protein